jgi:hypothetical protein
MMICLKNLRRMRKKIRKNMNSWRMNLMKNHRRMKDS